MTEAPAPPAVFPEALGAAVRAAANEFFGTHCGLHLTEQPAGTADEPCAGIMGVMSFFGPPAWSFALVLPEPTAVAVAAKFAGFEVAFRSPDMGDLVGEMANVVAGDISARLDGQGVPAQMSLPTVARGHDVELLPPSDAVTDRVGFDSPTGPFSFKLVQARTALPGARRPGA